MQELFTLKIGNYTLKIADVHVALAVAVLLGGLAVAAL